MLSYSDKARGVGVLVRDAKPINTTKPRLRLRRDVLEYRASIPQWPSVASATVYPFVNNSFYATAGCRDQGSRKSNTRTQL